MPTPVLTMTTYILASVIMALVITAIVLTHLKIKDRERTREVLHRDPISKEEGIAVAIEDWKQHHHHHGNA